MPMLRHIILMVIGYIILYSWLIKFYIISINSYCCVIRFVINVINPQVTNYIKYNYDSYYLFNVSNNCLVLFVEMMFLEKFTFLLIIYFD